MTMREGFWEHVEELQKTVIQILIAIGIGIIICFFFYQQIFHFFTQPLEKSFKQRGLYAQELKRVRINNGDSKPVVYTLKTTQPHPSYLSEGVIALSAKEFQLSPGSFLDIEEPVAHGGLVIFGPIEGMLITLKVCFWCGVALMSPICVFLLLRFILPALHPQEHLLILPFLGMSALFILAGILLAYFVTIPIANSYLMAFNASVGINLWSLSNYLDYTLFLLLANAIAFELAVVLFFLVHLQILSLETMIAKRRHMIVIAFVIGALLTPPDILTQLMLAIPLILLYEIILLYARFRAIRAKASARGQDRSGHAHPDASATRPQAS